jgi:hypothetical protein
VLTNLHEFPTLGPMSGQSDTVTTQAHKLSFPKGTFQLGCEGDILLLPLNLLVCVVQCRPGSLPHAAHDPDRAHRELHYRLLRHDVVGPVCDAAQAFAQFGGVAGLKSVKVPSCSICTVQGRQIVTSRGTTSVSVAVQYRLAIMSPCSAAGLVKSASLFLPRQAPTCLRCMLLVQGQVPGFSTRPHLKVGRDVQDVTVYRNVSVVGLTTTYNGGIAIRVSVLCSFVRVCSSKLHRVTAPLMASLHTCCM